MRWRDARLCQLETELVLRSRCKLDKAAISGAFAQLFESGGVECDHELTVEPALHLWRRQWRADVADCLLSARAVHLDCPRSPTFGAGASRLPRADLLA